VGSPCFAIWRAIYCLLLPVNLTQSLDKSMNELVRPFADDSVYKWEFHGTNMREKGKQEWRRIGYEDRKRVFLEALSIVTENHLRLFAAVIDKKSCAEGEDLTKMLFEQTTSRFDQFLSRINRNRKERNLKEKGILIVDRAQKELEVQRLALEFKHEGYTWGKLKNMAEVPLFLDSKSSRLIQLADLIAFAVYRNFQHGDTMYYNIIRDNFDCDNGHCHGLWIKQ
ncbi:MAG: DUF3800 domain-containing protein, partial [Akkermansia sp.]